VLDKYFSELSSHGTGRTSGNRGCWFAGKARNPAQRGQLQVNKLERYLLVTGSILGTLSAGMNVLKAIPIWAIPIGIAILVLMMGLLILGRRLIPR
jgi:hypothetical protein